MHLSLFKGVSIYYERNQGIEKGLNEIDMIEYSKDKKDHMNDNVNSDRVHFDNERVEEQKKEERTSYRTDEAKNENHPWDAKRGARSGADAEEQMEKDHLEKEENDTGEAKGEEVVKLKEEMDSLKDTLMRRQADFENYKKRVHKDREEQKKLAIKDLALDIININDDLLRAVDAASNIPKDETLEHAHQAFVEGVIMISRQIEGALEKYGIHEIDSLYKEFNPNYNEAVEIDMSKDVDHDTVTKIYQKGFTLNDLVIRSAKVKVTKPIKAPERVSKEGGVEGKTDGDEEGNIKNNIGV